MKFLIIRFGAIGDLVLATPVIRCLKNGVPDAEIHFLLDGVYKEVLQANPYIHKIHEAGDGDAGLLRALEEERLDFIIDLQRNKLSRRIKAALDVRCATYNALRFERFLFTRLKWSRMPKTHLVDRYLEALEPFEVQNDGGGLDFFILPQDEVPQRDIPASHHAGFIALVIGASAFTKKLPLHKLQELCAAIPHPIILLGGKSEWESGEQIKKVDNVKVYNACGKFSLGESADLIRKSKLVISHDTGLMHIAAAFKKLVIAIWGSTTPSLGIAPYYGKAFEAQRAAPYDAVQVSKLWCRPCTDKGRERCPQGHFKCMKGIAIEEIVQKTMARLKLL